MDETIGESGWWGVVGGWSVGLNRPSWRFGLLQQGFQSLLTVLAVEVQGGSSGGAVKKRIGRPFSRCRVVRCGDRLNGCRCVDEPLVSTDGCGAHRLAHRREFSAISAREPLRSLYLRRWRSRCNRSFLCGFVCRCHASDAARASICCVSSSLAWAGVGARIRS